MGVYVSGTIWMDGRRPVVTQPAEAAPSPPASGPTWDATAHADGIDLSNSNRTASTTATGIDLCGLSTLAIAAGDKTWVEISVDSASNEDTAHVLLGIGNAATDITGGAFLGNSADSIGYESNGNVLGNNASLAAYSDYLTGAVINIAIDKDAGTVEWFLGGVSQGDPISHGITGDLFVAYNVKYDGTTLATVTLVQPGSFTNAPPAGFTEYGA